MTFVHQVAYAINNGIGKLEAAAALGFIGIMGPIPGGFIFDKTGSYRSGWIMNTIFLVIISLLILALNPSRSRLQR
jgi:cyanate permease